MADLMDEAIEISHKLIPCNICGRTFLPSPLKKHAKVCEKNATRKRKTFNSLKQRLEGTELAVFHQKSYLRRSENICQGVPAVAAAPSASHFIASAANEQKRNQSKWKEKHEELVQAIRAAKGENIMAPRRSISAVGSMGTTEQCPSCDRHFGPKAYDRHVEWCKEHKIRASKSPAIVTIAKERLEARTKYRVPPLNKSKRSVTRDKYASPSGRGPDSLVNVRSTSSLEPPLSNTRKIKQKSGVPAQNHCPPLLGEAVIKHNTEKLKSINFQKEKDDYDPFLIAEKQLMDLLQGDDFNPYKNTSNNSKTPSPKTKLKSLPAATKQKSSNTNTNTNKPNQTHKQYDSHFQEKINSLQDNFEIIENFINDNFIHNNANTNTNEIKRKFSDEISNAIDPKLINANDNLKIPDELMIDQLTDSPISYTNDVDHYSAQYDKHISMLEPLVLPKTEMKRSHSHLSDADFEAFISSFDDGDDDGLPTLKRFLSTAVDVKHTKKKSFNCSFGKNATMKHHNTENNKKVVQPPPQPPLTPLKRSVSLSNPVVKARSMKNKQDIQDYLHVRDTRDARETRDTRETKPSSREKLKALSPRSSDELFPVGHDMYNEYKKYEELYRRESQHSVHDENDEHDGSSNENEDRDDTPPHQHKHQQQQQQQQPMQSERKNGTSHTKANAVDSAYGSLNRKSVKIQQVAQKNPRQAKTTTQHVKRSPSSSGSETCPSIPAKQCNRLTKFCHECGTKYPLDCAKFCVECGIKRLVL